MNKDINISYKSKRAYVFGVHTAHKLYQWGFFPDNRMAEIEVELSTGYTRLDISLGFWDAMLFVFRIMSKFGLVKMTEKEHGEAN